MNQELWDALNTLSDKTFEAWSQKQHKFLTLETLQAIKTQAEQTSTQGDLEAALSLLDRGALVAQGIDDPSGIGLIWRGRANVLEQHEHYEESLQASHEAASLYTRYGTPFDVAVARTIEIYVLGALERFDEAIELGQWVRQQFMQKDSDWAKFGLANVAANLGQVYTNAWRLPEAMQEYEAAVQLYQEIDLSDKVAQTFHDMGVTAFRMDHLASAKGYYAQAQPGLAAAGRISVLVKLHFNLAEIHIRSGAYEEALAHLSEARVILSKLPNSPDHAFVDLFEAQVRRELNDTRQAQTLIEHARATFEELGRRIETAQAYLQLSHLLSPEESPEKLGEALYNLQQAEAQISDLNMPLFVAYLKLEQSELLLKLGRFVDAAILSETAHHTFTAANLALRVAQADVIWADSSWRLHPEKAQCLYKSALQSAKQALPLLAVRCWRGLGRIASLGGDIQTAEEHYEKAIILLDSVRHNLRGHSHQAGFLDDKQNLHQELLVALHAQPNQEYKILGWTERFKARVLADLLSEQPPSYNLDLTDLLEERKQLRRDLDRCTASAMANSETLLLVETRQRGPAIAAHDDYQTQQLTNLQRQLQHVEEEIARRQNPAYEWQTDTSINPRQVHSLLNEETIMVTYYAIEGRLYALTATNKDKDIQLHELHISLKEIEERWQQTSRLLMAPIQPMSAVQARLAYFWKALIAPIEKRLQGKPRLLILPHRELFALPFGGFWNPYESSYLLERWTIQTAPSLTILARCKQQEQEKLEPLFVGNPGDSQQSDYLPNIEEEIHALTCLFPKATVLLNQEATAENIIDAMPGRSILHIASHAIYDTTAPLESGILLSHKQWLRAADLYLAYGKIKGATVVLSGCSTGRGKASGEDILGLNSGFMYAGASSVISGLWRVDDHATRELMVAFYKLLSEGEDSATALRLAQLNLLNSLTFSHPYYWAPFILNGDSRPLT